MACKGSAVRSRLAPPDKRVIEGRIKNSMKLIGQWIIYAGIVLVITGLIGGFTAMAKDADSMATNLLVLVPLGFAALLTGTVMTQLSGTRQ